MTEFTETDEKGDFCLLLESGVYTLEVMGPVVFSPKLKTVNVIDKPLSNIKFVQKKVNLGVSVKKLPASDWGDITIILTAPEEEATKVLTLKDMSLAQDDRNVYSGSFPKISPGEYQLEVIRAGWCWKERTIDVHLLEDDYEAPSFHQIGLEKKLMYQRRQCFSFFD